MSTMNGLDLQRRDPTVGLLGVDQGLDLVLQQHAVGLDLDQGLDLDGLRMPEPMVGLKARPVRPAKAHCALVELIVRFARSSTDRTELPGKKAVTCCWR
jgi:hypothetical protein